MKTTIILFLLGLSMIGLAQTFPPGVYRLPTLTVESDGYVHHMDSSQEADPTVSVDIKAITNTDQNHWNSTYENIRDNFYPGSYVMQAVPVNNPTFVNTLYFSKITSWPGTSSQFIKADGSTGTILTSLPPSGSAGGDLTGTYPNPTLATSGVSAGTFDWVTVSTNGIVTSAGNAPVITAIAGAGRNLNQAYQISSTRPSAVSVSPSISCNLSLSGGQAGDVVFEISANGTTGWIYSGQISGSNTGALTIGLNTTQVTVAPIYQDIPAGYYWRLRTNNVTGTPTYSFTGGSYKIY